MKRSWLLVPVLALFALTGCLAGIYYTNAPPPPDRVEVVGVAPGPEFIWISRYWGWRGGAHVWVPGFWCARRIRARYGSSRAGKNDMVASIFTRDTGGSVIFALGRRKNSGRRNSDIVIRPAARAGALKSPACLNSFRHNIFF